MPTGVLFSTTKKQASLTGRPTKLEQKKSFRIPNEVSALLDVRHCPKLPSCVISKKTNDTNLRKWQKP